MKTLLLSTLSILSFSISAFADVPTWAKGVQCGGYRVSEGTDSSKYVVELGTMKDGKIPAVLFTNWSDGSYSSGESPDACKTDEDGIMKCSVTERGWKGVTTTVTIDTNSNAAKTAEEFPAKFFNIKLGISRMGTCKFRSTADSDIKYYTNGRIDPTN